VDRCVDVKSKIRRDKEKQEGVCEFEGQKQSKVEKCLFSIAF